MLAVRQAQGALKVGMHMGWPVSKRTLATDGGAAMSMAAGVDVRHTQMSAGVKEAVRLDGMGGLDDTHMCPDMPLIFDTHKLVRSTHISCINTHTAMAVDRGLTSERGRPIVDVTTNGACVRCASTIGVASQGRWVLGCAE